MKKMHYVIAVIFALAISGIKGDGTFTLASRKMQQVQSVSKDLLVDCARLSDVSYYNPTQIQAAYESEKRSQTVGSSGVDEVGGPGLQKVSKPPVQYSNSKTNASATVFYYKENESCQETFVIAFQGTDSVQDYLQDAIFVQTYYRPSGLFSLNSYKCDLGFFIQWDSLRSQIDPVIEIAASKKYPIIVTGHSLGSAAGLLAAVYYNQLYPGRVQYIGYGTPRVANSEFQQFIDNNIKTLIRVKNGGDPVSKIPPKKLPNGLDYNHVGLEYHVGQTDPNPDVVELQYLSDHRIVNYVANILNSLLVISKVSK